MDTFVRVTQLQRRCIVRWYKHAAPNRTLFNN